MPDGKEEIYSIMFTSLKHPIRRKILRILSGKPLAFSEMLEILGISSSNLTYHLENLGELVSKEEDGVYRLSTFGQASVSTMKIVEEAPQVQPRKGNPLVKKWRIVAAILLVSLIVCTSVVALEFGTVTQAVNERDTIRSDYNQLLAWASTTNEAIDFLQNVVQLDTSKYEATLLSRTVETRKDIGGVSEEIMRYSLTDNNGEGSTSKLIIVFNFRNCEFYRYQLTVEEGSPIYAQAQSPFVVDAAKNVIDRLQNYESRPHLANMSQLMLRASNSENIEIREGNIKLTADISGDKGKILMEYTQNDVDFSVKSLELVFENNVLKQLTDGWNLFTIGSTDLKISSDRAVTLAKSALDSYRLESGGMVFSSLKYNPEPASIIFHPNTKEGLELFPQWIVTFYLDEVYAGDIYMISVPVWGDTGEIGKIDPRNSPQILSG